MLHTVKAVFFKLVVRFAFLAKANGTVEWLVGEEIESQVDYHFGETTLWDRHDIEILQRHISFIYSQIEGERERKSVTGSNGGFAFSPSRRELDTHTTTREEIPCTRARSPIQEKRGGCSFCLFLSTYYYTEY